MFLIYISIVLFAIDKLTRSPNQLQFLNDYETYALVHG